MTTTTHKTLRGPRGGVVFARADLPEGVDRADFPALGKSTLAQAIDKSRLPGHPGRPADARRRGQGRRVPARRDRRVPARPGADDRERRASSPQTLADAGARLVSGGTDNHLALVDVTPLGVTGREAEALLDDVGITVNKNAIPFDAEPAQRRVRDPGRDAGHDDARHGPGGDDADRATGSSRRSGIATTQAVHERIRGEVRELVAGFPVPGLPRDAA